MKRTDSQIVPRRPAPAIGDAAYTPVSRDFDNIAYRAPLGGPDQRIVRDPHRMERGPDLAPPVIDEADEHREVGRQITVLPDEELEQRGRVGTMNESPPSSAHSLRAGRGRQRRSRSRRALTAASIERAQCGENVVDGNRAPRTGRLPERGLVADRGAVGCPGCEERALDLGLEARVTRHIERMQKTGKWLGHDRASFLVAIPFHQARLACRAHMNFGSESSRVKRRNHHQAAEMRRAGSHRLQVPKNFSGPS